MQLFYNDNNMKQAVECCGGGVEASSPSLLANNSRKLFLFRLFLVRNGHNVI